MLKKIFNHGIVALCLIGSANCYAGSTTKPVDLLIAKTLGPTPILEDLRYLSDTIGGRPTGTSAMDEAMQWGLKRFQTAGLTDAHLEAYTPPRNWLANIELASFVANNSAAHNLRIAAIPFSSSTAATGLEAPVYALTATDAKEITAHAAEIKGHWLLVPTARMHSIEDLLKEYLDTVPIFTAAEHAGAAGVLWQSNRSGRLLYRHNASLNGEIAPIPAAIIEREGSERMIRSLHAGEKVKFKATIQNIVQEQPRDYNVVAEIKGATKPDEIIIFGAHLDSWDLGQGALDNGSNVAMVIDVARQIHSLQQQGFKPSRTIRFMLYSGEELGMFGSWYAVKNHPKELDNIKAVIIYDIGTGRTTGFSLGGRKDLLNLVTHALQPVSSLGPFTQTTDAFIGTDNFDYLLKGIPNLVANQEPEPYLPSYHAESDTYDKVDARELKINSTIAAVLTWDLANTNETIPPRQTTAAVKQLLETTGVKNEMQIYGIWNDFLNNKR